MVKSLTWYAALCVVPLWGIAGCNALVGNEDPYLAVGSTGGDIGIAGSSSGTSGRVGTAGTGGSVVGGGGSVSGTGGNAGGAGGSVGSGGSGDSCAYDSDACQNCFTDNCASEVFACIGDTDCYNATVSLDLCMCDSAASASTCISAFTATGSLESALESCVTPNCSAACGL
ncbi:MAG TPA: hypothetical protein VGM29_09745 [Polyangiaceae bacterium]